jgi:sugar lactone lactonase YvrE/pimeloyl-ACP methyl ester carboxylesterase
MRLLFCSVALTLVLGLTFGGVLRGQDYGPPKVIAPSDEAKKQIVAKGERLFQALAGLVKQGVKDNVLADIEVYLRAAQSIVALNEFHHKDSAAWTLAALDRGLLRARLLSGGETPWLFASGQTVVRGYRSRIDGSVQPFAVTYPLDFGKDQRKRWRVDVELHGRTNGLTEVQFLQGYNGDAAVPREQDFVTIHIFGRGNNAYRWAGETDVFEAIDAYLNAEKIAGRGELSDTSRFVLRGFSMGGAGTWHLGLHYPDRWCVIGPGAGFTTTHGYAPKLDPVLPRHQEACLQIYDAIDYAWNAVNVPVVAYSGAKDPQKKAADNIEAIVKDKVEYFHHLIAPELEHKFPAEWFAKANELYKKYAEKGRDDYPMHVNFVTYTLKYPECAWIGILGMEKHYEKARAVAQHTNEEDPAYRITTENVETLRVLVNDVTGHAQKIEIDDERVIARPQVGDDGNSYVYLQRRAGKWAAVLPQRLFVQQAQRPRKVNKLTGPIDDAFTDSFLCVRGSAKPWHETTRKLADARLDRFRFEWEKYWRGQLPVKNDADVTSADIAGRNLILFGDPASNSLIAQVLDGLPLAWTKDEVRLAGRKFTADTHLPVLIYPNPLNPSRYVVLNSGHTFPTTDYDKTNALLFPRLGDYGVLRPHVDDAVGEAVMAGLFNDSWQVGDDPIPKLEKLWSEGDFTEGPAYGPDGCVYFSDIGNRIMKFDPKTKKTSEYRNPSGRANGLDFDPEGRLVACEGANTGGNRRVTITEKDGSVRVLADRYKGKRFNSPNDVTIDVKGRVYFTDPRYVGDEPRELDSESVYRIDPDGTVTRIIGDVTKPNGIIISPDMKTLYLAESHPKRDRLLLAYPLNADGTVGTKKVLHDFKADRGVDGMCVDVKGNIYATAGQGKTGGVYVFTPDGKKIDFVPTPETPTNCVFGDADRKTLYVTAGRSLYRIRLNVEGFAVYWPK